MSPTCGRPGRRRSCAIWRRPVRRRSPPTCWEPTRTGSRPERRPAAPGTGFVIWAGPTLPRGKVTRDDVAAVIAGLLDTPGTEGRTLELVEGDTPIDEAVRAVAS